MNLYYINYDWDFQLVLAESEEEAKNIIQTVSEGIFHVDEIKIKPVLLDTDHIGVVNLLDGFSLAVSNEKRRLNA